MPKAARPSTAEPRELIIDEHNKSTGEQARNIFARSGVGAPVLATVFGTAARAAPSEEVDGSMDTPRYPPPHDWLRLPAIRDTDWVESRFGHS